MERFLQAGGFKAFDYVKAAGEAEAAAVPHVAQFDPHGTIASDVKHKEVFTPTFTLFEAPLLIEADTPYNL